MSLTIDDLLEKYKPERQQEGDITVEMLKAAWGLEDRGTVARRARATLVKEEGYIEIKDAILDNGGTGIVFRKVG